MKDHKTVEIYSLELWEHRPLKKHCVVLWGKYWASLSVLCAPPLIGTVIDLGLIWVHVRLLSTFWCLAFILWSCGK